MSLVPDDLVYSRNHIWLRMTDEFTGTCGITDHAQELLKDIVFAELIEEGMEVNTDEKILYIESIVDIFDIMSPLSGKVIKLNASLESMPGIINEDPYGEGWMVKFTLADPVELDSLMDPKTYEAYCAGRQH